MSKSTSLLYLTMPFFLSSAEVTFSSWYCQFFHLQWIFPVKIQTCYYRALAKSILNHLLCIPQVVPIWLLLLAPQAYLYGQSLGERIYCFCLASSSSHFHFPSSGHTSVWWLDHSAMRSGSFFPQAVSSPLLLLGPLSWCLHLGT